jgi:spermidine synthase
MDIRLISRRMLLSLLVAAMLAIPALAQEGRTVYEVKSEFQFITVWDSPEGYRQLIFDGKFDGTDPIQSEMKLSRPTDLTLPYSRHMITALPVVAKTGRILVVGLGGACIQRYLHMLLPDAIIETAELDPAVLDVARKFFFFKEDAGQKVHIGDGRRFIEQSREKYDLIMLDAFSATSIPYMLATKEFLEIVKDHLATGGAVCTNLWYDQEDYHDMLKTYAAVFPEWHLMRCPHSTNAILLALPTRQNLTPEKWMAMATEFETIHRTGLDLPRLIDRGIEPATRIPSDAKVLLDADANKHR